jgi:uncharacterized protein with HEPN domain
MSKQPDVYLELALRALERVPRFLADRTLDASLEDEFRQSAVERQLEIAATPWASFASRIPTCSPVSPKVR